MRFRKQCKSNHLDKNSFQFSLDSKSEILTALKVYFFHKICSYKNTLSAFAQKLASSPSGGTVASVEMKGNWLFIVL